MKMSNGIAFVDEIQNIISALLNRENMTSSIK